MNVLSLFDGISVAQQALKELGVKVDSYYASEIDKYAVSITQKNFPDTIQLGDIKDIGHGTIARLQNKMICEIDLIVGGFPCQDLSIAKKDRKGLKGERSGLFYEMLRIHREVKPKWFVYENVASMAKDQKELITQEISKVAGKRIEPVMINASLVSAQNRKRLFWTNIPNITQPEDRGILLKDILEGGDTERLKSYCLDANYFKGGKIGGTHQSSTRNYTIRLGQFNSGGQGDRVYSPEGKSVGLSALGGGRGAKTGLYAVKSIYNKTLNYNKANTLGSNSQCQTAKTGQGLVDFEKQIIRKLTPIECERLQSLPDFFSAKGINEKGEEIIISNSQRYKALGNAFNCEVVKHILSFIP